MKHRFRTALLPVLVFAAAACESPTDPAVDKTPLDRLPRQLSAQEQAVIQANQQFSFNLLRETLRTDNAPNVFLSPLSASMALGMTMNGARGATLDGMRTALGFDQAELSQINESYRSLIDLLRGLDSSVEIQIGNSIWARAGYPFHQSFFDTTRRYFDAEVATLDFNRPDAAATINAWVHRSTKGKIEKIVEGSIPSDVVMYLINAIYFKGAWQQPFDPKLTIDAPFHLADGTEKTVRMMQRRGLIRYHEDKGVQIAELLYGREAYAMTMVLPPAGADIDSFIAGLDAQRWQDWTAALQPHDVQIRMPRYKIEYKTTMNDALKSLGMGAAFGQSPGADFSAMSPNALWISKVLQKTFVEVNEVGTEAAAVTAVVMVDSAPPSVTFDRPFVVAIRERFSGTILFLGKIGSP